MNVQPCSEAEPTFERLEMARDPSKGNGDLMLSPITTVGDQDVLFGRGQAVNDHPGNLAFRTKVRERKRTFQESKKKDKRNVALNLVKDILASGGQFLEEIEVKGEGGGSGNGGDDDEEAKKKKAWVRVGIDRALEKVMHRLREKEKETSVESSNPQETSKKRKKSPPRPSGESKPFEEVDNPYTKRCQAAETNIEVRSGPSISQHQPSDLNQRGEARRKSAGTISPSTAEDSSTDATSQAWAALIGSRTDPPLPAQGAIAHAALLPAMPFSTGANASRLLGAVSMGSTPTPLVGAPMAVPQASNPLTAMSQAGMIQFHSLAPSSAGPRAAQLLGASMAGHQSTPDPLTSMPTATGGLGREGAHSAPLLPVVAQQVRPTATFPNAAQDAANQASLLMLHLQAGVARQSSNVPGQPSLAGAHFFPRHQPHVAPSHPLIQLLPSSSRGLSADARMSQRGNQMLPRGPTLLDNQQELLARIVATSPGQDLGGVLRGASASLGAAALPQQAPPSSNGSLSHAAATTAAANQQEMLAQIIDLNSIRDPGNAVRSAGASAAVPALPQQAPLEAFLQASLQASLLPQQAPPNGDGAASHGATSVALRQRELLAQIAALNGLPHPSNSGAQLPGASATASLLQRQAPPASVRPLSLGGTPAGHNDLLARLVALEGQGSNVGNAGRGPSPAVTTAMATASLSQRAPSNLSAAAFFSRRAPSNENAEERLEGLRPAESLEWKIGAPNEPARRGASEGQAATTALLRPRAKARLTDRPRSDAASEGDPSRGSAGASPTLAANDEKWRMRYEALKRFRREHGHCNVPPKYAPDPKLPRWVARQRARYEAWKQGGEGRSRLSEERAGLLGALGF